MPGLSPLQPPDALVAAARERLAQRLGVPADSLTLHEASQQEWPDGALGCPAAGQLYPQVITPGFLLIFNAGAQTYAVHTGGSEQLMILCEDGRPTNLADQVTAPAAEAQTNATTQPLVEQSSANFAKENAIAPRDCGQAS